MRRHPGLIFAVVFASLLALTQFLAYQQYRLSKEAKKVELIHEATSTRGRLRDVLFNDIASDNALAIIYKQYGVSANFDSVASQIIQASRYAEALQITENGVVKNAYPDKGYKGTIGTNVNSDPLRQAEEKRAIERKEIYFAGPRRLRFGDTGILGKLPIIVGDKVVAVGTVLTRLPAIKKALELSGAEKGKFAYQLLKHQDKLVSIFPLSDINPAANSQYVDVDIPEGDWTLRTYYGNNSAGSTFPFEMSALGLLFSFIAALLAYRKAREPYMLKKIIDEKTAELAKSERYFRTLIETSSDAVILCTANGKVLYQTPSAETITGYSLSERQKISRSDLVHPDDIHKENNPVFLNNTGKVLWQKIRLKHKDGHYIWVEGSYQNLLNDENVGAIVISYSDITEKVLSEESLIESENRFRRAFEDSAIGMGLTAIDKEHTGKWIKVNKSLCSMLGYTQDELLSKTFMEITHLDDVAKGLAAHNGVLSGESDTYRVEKRYIHKDGSIVWINLNVSMVRDKDEKPIYLLAQVENISEKVESQIQFQNLVENFVVGVYVIQDNRLVYANPQLLEETGYSPKDAKNLTFDQVIYPEDLDLVKEMIDIKTSENLRSTRYEARIQRKDGSPIWYEILSSITIYNGAPALIGTTINITERKKLTLDLLNYVDEVEVQNKKLRDIAWIQSHVVRAPLARLMALIDLFKQQDETERQEEGQLILDHIIVSANELDNVIKDISERVYDENDDSVKPA
jgi:PAS domain S-box-containing protein